ncbi:MAG: plasmid pRiA4b ORF-3 family protein [Actinobacteria bacterium]|nr:plasmid pRiA4b ORF-3 family protein [Actinomycetota bacterium]
MVKKFDKVYQFKISLKGITPLVWRRIQVPATYNFWDLHVAIQDAMGWLDYHLHDFHLDDPVTGKQTRIGMILDELDPFDDYDVVPEKSQYILSWFLAENATARYLYDFGDCWEHEVKLEKILPKEKGASYPRCIAGERACPPEDVGGVSGYEQFLDAINDANNEDHERMLEWVGGSFDPEYFNAQEVSFDNPDERWSIAFGGREGIALPLLHARNSKKFSASTAGHSVEHDIKHDVEAQQDLTRTTAAATANTLRIDMLALLNYIGDRELKLTQAGNLMLKDVRAINELFVEPKKLDYELGGCINKLRTEEEVYRVWFLRILSQKGSLTKIQRNKISLTKTAKEFLKKDPHDQLLQLFTAWLTKDHWGRWLYWPEVVEPIMHKAYDVAYYLSKIPVGVSVEYDIFEQGLLNTLRLGFATDDPERAKQFSYIAIAQAILEPLELFGVVSLERGKDKYGHSKVAAVSLTELGRRFLVG